MRPHILIYIQEKGKEKHAEKEQSYAIIALSQKLLSYLSTPFKIEVIFFSKEPSYKEQFTLSRVLLK